jgi:uncharacterized membrane protein YkgB
MKSRRNLGVIALWVGVAILVGLKFGLAGLAGVLIVFGLVHMIGERK